MAFIYVQFWGPPTLLNEFYLGTSPLRPANPQTSMSQQAVHHEDEEIGKGQQRIPSTSSQETASQTAHLSSQQQYAPQQHIQARPELFTMNPLATALPDLSYQSYGQMQPQRYPTGPSSSGLFYHLQNAPQYAGQQSVGSTNASYQYQGPYQGMYAANSTPSPTQPQPGTAVGSQLYHQGFMGQPHQQGSPYFIPPSHYNAQSSQIYPGLQQPAQYGTRGNFVADGVLQQRGNDFLGVAPPGGGPRSSSSISELPQL
jgi:hypothetical protein